MPDPITSLTDDQAIQAVKLFYDFAPPELWENQEKPSPDRVKTIAAALVKQAPPDVQPAVAALMEDGSVANRAARAEVCRLLLSQLRESPAFQPFVDRAIESAARPHMLIDPITGAFIIAILLATSRKVGGGAVVVDAIKALRLPELLHEMPAVLKALPEGVWNALIKVKGA